MNQIQQTLDEFLFFSDDELPTRLSLIEQFQELEITKKIKKQRNYNKQEQNQKKPPPKKASSTSCSPDRSQNKGYLDIHNISSLTYMIKNKAYEDINEAIKWENYLNKKYEEKQDYGQQYALVPYKEPFEFQKKRGLQQQKQQESKQIEQEESSEQISF